MTPTSQGAFCSTCNVDVIDFSRLTLEQVKRKLLQTHGEHTCGRFDQRQLELLNSEFENWKADNRQSFQSKFIFALMVAFGLTLFSCSEEDSSQIEAFNFSQIQTLLEKPENREADKLFFFQDTIISNEMLKLETLNQCNSTGSVNNLTNLTEVAETIDEINVIHAVAGGIGYREDYKQFLVETVSTDTIEPTSPDYTETYGYNRFEIKVYPNPASEASTILIQNSEEALYRIHLYALNGQLIQVIYEGTLSVGQNQFTVDLTDIDPGQYLVSVASEKQKETKKLVKL